MTHDFQQHRSLPKSQVDDLLDDLEMRCRTDVSAARGMATLRFKAAVTIRLANACERDVLAIVAETVELKSQSTKCMSGKPIAVGSVFHLTFDRDELDITPQLAVCDRCTMLGDMSFEVGFKFAREVILPVQEPAV